MSSTDVHTPCLLQNMIIKPTLGVLLLTLDSKYINYIDLARNPHHWFTNHWAELLRQMNLLAQNRKMPILFLRSSFTTHQLSFSTKRRAGVQDDPGWSDRVFWYSHWLPARNGCVTLVFQPIISFVNAFEPYRMEDA